MPRRLHGLLKKMRHGLIVALGCGSLPGPGFPRASKKQVSSEDAILNRYPPTPESSVFPLDATGLPVAGRGHFVLTFQAVVPAIH